LRIKEVKQNEEKSIVKVKEYIYHQSKNNTYKIFCNNLNVTKQLLDIKNLFFWGFTNSKKIGNYSFEDIYEEYPIVSDKIVADLIAKYKIDLALFDNSTSFNISKNKILLNNFDFVFAAGSLNLYKLK
jgi:hypothetical protein